MTEAKYPFRDPVKQSRYQRAARYVAQTERVGLYVREAFSQWFANADQKKFKDPALAWAYYKKKRSITV
jgi:hypothetical protein